MHGGTQRGLGKAAAAPGVVGLRLSLGGAWLHGVLAAVRGLAEVLAKAWTATSTDIAPFLKVSFCTSPSLQSPLRICGLFGGEEEQVVVAWLCATGTMLTQAKAFTGAAAGGSGDDGLGASFSLLGHHYGVLCPEA